MLTHNPFADLFPAALMQGYVILMVLLVLGSTIFDTIHKKSAKYFFQAAEKSKKSQTRSISGGEKTSIAVKTAVNEVMLSSEFCNARRRIAHLLGMYGFVMFLITTIILIFSYPTSATPAPALVTGLWHIGALMVAVGGYWFWFFIRVDVAAEGNVWYKIMRADLFILALLATTTFRSCLVLSSDERGRALDTNHPSAFHYFKHNVVRHRAVVQVCSYVFQTRRCISEAGPGSRWVTSKPSGASR